MIQLVIDYIDGYRYYLKDGHGKVYSFMIEFHYLEKNPKVDDILYINEELLKECNGLFSFGVIESEYGRRVKSSNERDVIVLFTEGKEYVLKRIYG